MLENTSKPQIAGLAAAVVLTVLLCLPFLRMVDWFGDEGILLHAAVQMSSGKKLYADFFEFFPPAGFLTTQGWIYLFGHSFAAVRLFAVATATGLSCFTYLACILVCRNTILSLFLTLCCVTASAPGLAASVSYHWLTSFFSMAALWLALSSAGGGGRDDIRVGLSWLSGLAAGSAAMVMSSSGLWVLMAAVLTFADFPRLRREFAACLLGGLTVPVLCLAYIVLNGAFVPAYDDIVGFTLGRYSSIQSVPFGRGFEWYHPFKSLFLVADGLALLMLVRNNRAALDDSKFRACVLFSLAGFAGVFPRPDAAHIMFTIPLVMPLIAYCALRLTEQWSVRSRWLALGIAMLWFIQPTAMFLIRSVIVFHAPVVETAAGPISLVDDEERPDMSGRGEIFRFIASTPADGRYLFYPYLPLLPFLAQRQDVSKNDIFVPGYTTRAQYFDACRAALQNAKWVILDRVWMNPVQLKASFPAMKDPHPPEVQAFEWAIQHNFSFVERAGSLEVWRRVAATNVADCSKITANGN